MPDYVHTYRGSRAPVEMNRIASGVPYDKARSRSCDGGGHDLGPNEVAEVGECVSTTETCLSTGDYGACSGQLSVQQRLVTSVRQDIETMRLGIYGIQPPERLFGGTQPLAWHHR
jgi:hypothetical protein